jgi:hypothetical protein
MENVGAIRDGDKTLPVQRDGRQVYVSGYPVENYPRRIREAAQELVCRHHDR